jgi:hypothetical protein
MQTDEEKRAEARERDVLNTQLRRYKSASDEIRDPRAKLYEEWEEFQRGHHWGKDVGSDHPSIPLTWYIWDSQVAKVCDRPVKMSVVSQESCDFPIYKLDEFGNPVIDPATGDFLPDQSHPFLQMVAANQEVLGSSELTHNEIYAKFLNALLQRTWEANQVPSRFYQAAAMSAWYSECWLLVGRDDMLALRGESPIFIDLIHPKRIIKDPEASGVQDARFLGYEVPRTLGYIRQRFGDEKADAIQPALTEGERDSGISHGDDRAQVMLECWFVRDDSMEKHLSDPILPVDAEDPMTYYELPKYTNGWFKVLRCQNKILSGPDDAGRLPLAWFPWGPIPGRLESIGVMDNYRSMNFQIDQSMYYALENARTTGQNWGVYDEAAFQGREDELSNLPGKLLGMTDASGNVQNKFVMQQGLDVAPSHYQNISINRELMEAMSGSQDLKVNSNLPRDASGEFMKELKAGIASRLAIIRDEHMLPAAKHIVRVMLDLLLDDDEPVTVRLPGIGEPKYIQITPSALNLSDDDFEAKFDLVADGSIAEPHNPIERDQYYDGILRSLMDLPQPIAELRINLADWSRKEEIRSTMQAFWQQQEAQAAQSAEQMSPEMLKAKAQAAGQVAKDFSQGMQNLADGIADAGERALAIDTLIAAIPISVAISQGQEPDLTPLDAIRARFNERMEFLAMAKAQADRIAAENAAQLQYGSDPQAPPMMGGILPGT